MREFGIITEKNTVRFERMLPGPIERVWSYLTDSEKRGKWLASGPMDLRVGGAVELTFRHADLSPKKAPAPERYKKIENGVTSHERVTQCDPPRLLAITWGDDENPGASSEVTFELIPRGSEVLLVLTHRRLGGRAEMVDVSGGWHTHLGILEARLAGREPEPFWAAHAGIEEAYEQRFPKD